MKKLRLVASALMAFILLVTCLVSITYGWRPFESLQEAKNETQVEGTNASVRLLKLDKETQLPLADAQFYLFRVEEGGDKQINGRFVTDANGYITVSLPAGTYYFQEVMPPGGYGFDKDDQGNSITRYYFTVTQEDILAFQESGEILLAVTAYNIPLKGPLVLQKLVQNADGTPVTPEQEQLEFTFTVTFSDGGTHAYRIDGKGDPIPVASGGTITLKHGQSAVFENIPVGVLYTITESTLADYVVSGTGHRGNITVSGCEAIFVNTYDPEETGSLTVTKEVRGEGADLNKEFTFTAVVGGETVSFTLKHGEKYTFPDLPIGTVYTVTETDYTDDGYIASVREYTGVITGAEEFILPFVNVYDETPEGTGDLIIEKEVVGEGADPDKVFTFTVTFSDGGSYAYRVNGEGDPIPVASGGTFTLKHGQRAVFEDIPAGVTYTVTETDPAGYLPGLDTATGVIIPEDTVLVTFRNRVPEDPVKIRITKVLAGEYPEHYLDKEFAFTITIDGVEHKFVLKPGESIVFEAPDGAQYEVTEEDYFYEDLSQYIENGFGIVNGQDIEVIATNTFVGKPEVDIGGEKRWELGGYTVQLPESIIVRLKNGDTVVEEKIVTPDDTGRWHYTFTADKYDADGNEIVYTVEELPLEHFKTTYDGYDIINWYIPPVSIDPPIIVKRVEGENAPQAEFEFILEGQPGAPMPQGAVGNILTLRMSGAGELELGQIVFDTTGVYTYTIRERIGSEAGWTYDQICYLLTVNVFMEDGALKAQYTLTKVGEHTQLQQAEFVNLYEEPLPDTVVISGQKIWNHGLNPSENHPESIVVHVYADGVLIGQWQVTAKSEWCYTFELPKYAADGHEIVYTIDEKEIPGYTKQIDGYNLINTYVPPDPSGPSSGGTPTTGDSTNVTGLLIVMIVSAVLLVALVAAYLIGLRKKRAKAEKPQDQNGS